MIYRIRQRCKKSWFDMRCKGVKSTRQMEIKNAPVKIVSMVCHADVTMYLLAIKSFYSYFGRGAVVVLNDGSLIRTDVQLLRSHLSNCEIVDIRDVSVRTCPKGGCWERLLFISDCVSDSYVIQIDSDTLTLNSIPEAVESFAENHSFALGTAMGRAVVSINDFCREMKTFTDNHVQVIAEQSFDRLRKSAELKYVRASAGFAGFAKGSFSRGKVEAFSEEMRGLVGKIWSDWGSEQVTSNFFVANAPKVDVLPYPKYCNFTPATDWKGSSFLHFIGTYRFSHGVYARKAREVIEKLQSAGVLARRC